MLHDFWDVLKHNVVSHNQVRSMVGNGWSLPTFGPWIMFLLANIDVKKSVIPQTPRRASEADALQDSESVTPSTPLVTHCETPSAPLVIDCDITDTSSSEEPHLKLPRTEVGLQSWKATMHAVCADPRLFDKYGLGGVSQSRPGNLCFI